jgi:hypothetical protein
MSYESSVHDLLLLGTMFVVCGGIGLPVARLLPQRFAWRVLIAPTLGYGVLAVAVPIAYRAGLSIRGFFFASLTIAVISIALHARRCVREARTASFDERRRIKLIVGACVAATLVMMAPRWLGGDRFSAFQGNTWDTYGYLDSAVVYARESHSYVASAGEQQFAQYPLVAIAQSSLVNRPSVHQLYAVFSRVAPGDAYRLYYPFLVGSFAQFVLVALFVLQTMFSRRALRRCAIAAVVFPLGFWGQYVLDINAWSQLASVPSLFLILGLAVDIAVREEPDLRSGARLAAVLAIAVAGALFIYPEGFIVYAAAAGPIAGLPSLVRAIRSRRWAGLMPLLGFAGFGAAILYGPTWDFLIGQLTRTAMQKVSWWQFFQVFFFGRDGDAGPTAIDFTGGFFGLYFATPTVKASAIVAVLSRLAIVAMVLGIIAGVGAMLAGKYVRDDGVPDQRRRIIAWAIASVLLLVPAVMLLMQDNYWPAGKCVSYASPVFVTLFCLPIIVDFVSPVLRMARWLVVAYVVFQLATSISRTHAAKKHGHYGRPYPGILDPGLKKNLPWDFEPFERVLDDKTHVLVRVPDVWPRAHVMVFLYSRGIPFAIEGKVNTYFDGGATLDAMPPLWEPDAEIVQEPRGYALVFRDGRAPIRIVAKR